MPTIRSLAVVVLAVAYAALAPCSAASQETGGVLEIRTIVVSPAVLTDLAGANDGQPDRARVFGLEPEEILAHPAAQSASEPGVQVMAMHWAFRGPRARFELHAPGIPDDFVHMLLDSEDGSATLVVPMIGHAQRIPLGTFFDQQRGVLESVREEIQMDGADFRDLGERVVNGHRARGVEVTHGDDVTVSWVTPALKLDHALFAGWDDFLEGLQRMLATVPSGWEGQIPDGGAVRTQGLTRTTPEMEAQGVEPGYMYVIMDVLSYSDQPPPAVRFELPEGIEVEEAEDWMP